MDVLTKPIGIIPGHRIGQANCTAIGGQGNKLSPKTHISNQYQSRNVAKSQNEPPTQRL